MSSCELKQDSPVQNDITEDKFPTFCSNGDREQTFECRLYFEPPSTCELDPNRIEARRIDEGTETYGLNQRFLLYNPNLHPICYKIKTSTRRMIEVFPSIGAIDSGKQEVVYVKVNPSEGTFRLEAAITVYASPVPRQMLCYSKTELREFWRDVPPEQTAKIFVLLIVRKKTKDTNATEASSKISKDAREFEAHLVASLQKTIRVLSFTVATLAMIVSYFMATQSW